MNELFKNTIIFSCLLIDVSRKGCLIKSFIYYYTFYSEVKFILTFMFPIYYLFWMNDIVKQQFITELNNSEG